MLTNNVGIVPLNVLPHNNLYHTLYLHKTCECIFAVRQMIVKGELKSLVNLCVGHGVHNLSLLQMRA